VHICAVNFQLEKEKMIEKGLFLSGEATIKMIKTSKK